MNRFESVFICASIFPPPLIYNNHRKTKMIFCNIVQPWNQTIHHPCQHHYAPGVHPHAVLFSSTIFFGCLSSWALKGRDDSSMSFIAYLVLSASHPAPGGDLIPALIAALISKTNLPPTSSSAHYQTLLTNIQTMLMMTLYYF